MLFDEFAAELDLPLRAGPSKILLHGHCHQKSMGLLPATMSLLSTSRRAVVRISTPAAAAWRARSATAKDHYEVSEAIANRSLLPAVKAMSAGDVLVRTGTSCRHQVADLGGAKAVHPAVLIRQLMANG